MFAEVALPISNFKTFTYTIPKKLHGFIHVGSRVSVPFKNRSSRGIVIDFGIEPSFDGKLKEIDSLIDDIQVVTPELWSLIVWMAKYYITPIGQVAKTVLPAQFSTKYTPRKFWYVKPNAKYDQSQVERLKARAPKQYKALKIMQSLDKEVKVSYFRQHVSNPLKICEQLAKINLVQLSKKKSLEGDADYVFRMSAKKIILNKDQESASKILKNALGSNKYSPFLLHGVTGSGKTEIFIEIVKQCTADGKTALILLPEISLTPQIAGRFKAVFGDSVALWHSKLSQAQRSWTWKEVCRGNFKVVIGARSAVFLPVKNLGVIVVDEEQETTFQQDHPAPRYHARDVALMRAKKNKCIALLSSATPSLESYYNYLNDKLEYIHLPSRYGGAVYPDIHLIDMNKEQRDSGKFSLVFSNLLLEKIEDRLAKKEQVILLQNRRGYSPVLVCRSCGDVLKCPYCNVAISFHIKNNTYLCHYCGFNDSRKTKNCISCNMSDFYQRGVGTQKVEEFLKESFPEASIARIDMDSSSSGKSINSLLESFSSGDIDILLGTQMIAKGLDFPNTTLVGIINADLGLYLPDFRAEEKIFQLIYQASGRSGRGEKKGEVIIQTFSSDNSTIKNAAKQNIKKFYLSMLKEREELFYPPYSWLAKIEISGNKSSRVLNSANEIFNLRGDSYKGLHVLGPNPCYIEKLKGQYRWQIIFKSEKTIDPNGIKLHQYIQRIIHRCQEKLNYKGNNVNIHVDPLSLV